MTGNYRGRYDEGRGIDNRHGAKRYMHGIDSMLCMPKRGYS